MSLPPPSPLLFTPTFPSSLHSRRSKLPPHPHRPFTPLHTPNVRKRLRPQALHQQPQPTSSSPTPRPPRPSVTGIDASISAGALNLLPDLVRRDIETLSYGAVLRAISALIRASHWRAVAHVYQTAYRYEPIRARFTARIFTDLFFSLMKVGTPDAASRAYQEWASLVEEGLDAKLIGPRAYNFLFVTLSRVGHVDEAMDVRSNCLQNGFYLNRYSYNAFLNACAKAHRIADAFDTLREMAECNVLPDVVSFNVLIACCVRSGDLDIALGILQRMKDWGISPDIYSYNSVVNGLRKCKMLEEAFQLVAQMEVDAANGADVPLITDIPKTLASGDASCATSTGKEDDKFQNSATDSQATRAAPLIKALTTAGRGASSHSLDENAFDEQEEGGDRETLLGRGDTRHSNANGTAAVSGEHRNDRDADAPEDIVDGDDERDRIPVGERNAVSPDLVTYNTLISGIAGLENPDFARATLVKKHMEARGIVCNEVTYNALMAVAARANKIKAAFDIYDEMISKSLKPNCECFTTLITLCGRADMIARAFDVHDRMIACGIKPSVITYNALLTACRGSAGRDSGDAALRILREMQRTPGCKPDVITYSTIIDALGRGGRFSQVRDVLEEMSCEGVEPNLVTYTSVISALTRAGDLEGALRVLEDMEEHGIKPNVYTFSSLIHGAGRQGHFRKALEMLHMMRDRGILASPITYSMLLHLAMKSGERGLLDDVVKVLGADARLKGTPQMQRIVHLSEDPDVFVSGKTKRIYALMKEAVEECIASPTTKTSGRGDRSVRGR